MKRKSILRKIFWSVVSIFLVTLLIQLFIQVNFIDDLYRYAKQDEMTKAFDQFVTEYDRRFLLEDTVHYFEDNNAALLVLDANKGILNTSYFDFMSYITVEADGQNYKVLMGDRVDERGLLLPLFQSYDLGHHVELTGYLFNGLNVLNMDLEEPSALLEDQLTIRGQVVSTHFIPRDQGVFSTQSNKLLREVSLLLAENDDESLIEFVEVETGLVLTILTEKLSDGTEIYSLFTIEDLSNTFVVLNRYYIGIFILQLLVLFGLVGVFSKWITKPIKQLTEVSKRIAHLDFTSHIDLKSGDELEELSDSLGLISNNMSSNIDRLENEAKEKEKSEARMRDLLANLSHEYKTPLSVMSGFVEMLHDESADKAYCLETIEDEIEKLNQLTKETLLLCESESYESYHLEEWHDLKTLVSINRFQHLIEAKNLAITINLDPVSVKCDGQKIQLVLNNLMSNGIKYSPAQSQLIIRSEVMSDRVKIYVENTGVTLSDETLERVWEKYYRAEKSRNKAYGGTGLGLSIVSNILTYHASDYGVYNTESSVVFYFDLKIIAE